MSEEITHVDGVPTGPDPHKLAAEYVVKYFMEYYNLNIDLAKFRGHTGDIMIYLRAKFPSNERQD